MYTKDDECGRRLALAVTQSSHWTLEAFAREGGASDVRVRSFLSRSRLTCKRRCMTEAA